VKGATEQANRDERAIWAGLVVGVFSLVTGCAGEDETPNIGPWAASDAEHEFAVHDNGGTTDGLDEIAINRYKSLP
jgi:hypothetical protein